MIRLLHRVRHANREQRKLLYSLGTNFLTRIPGAIGLLWFLPLLSQGLGTAQFANLLSYLSLGVAASFLAGGFSVVGRRLIGEAYARGDRKAEADNFASLIVANVWCGTLSLIVVTGYCWWRSDLVGFIIASISPLATFFNLFNDSRTAYNEHYINAILLTVLQSTFYAIGFLMPATQHNIYLAALIITSPYYASSIITAVLLLYHRPYLLRSKPTVTWTIIRLGSVMATADGLLMATMNLAAVWLQSAAMPDVAAWFATNVRLFQTFLTPIVVLMIPLSSYLRILWSTKTGVQRQAFTRIVFALSLGYGAIVTVALLFASRFYVNSMLHLRVESDIAVFVLFGAVVVYRSYSSIAYVVLDEVAHLSVWTTAAVVAAATVAAIASLRVDALAVINIYGLLVGLLVISVMLWNNVRAMRTVALCP